MASKQRYYVYNRKWQVMTEGTNEPRYSNWKYIGDTYAVSEAKAINNVRYREWGETKTDDHKFHQGIEEEIWECGYEWRAETKRMEI